MTTNVFIFVDPNANHEVVVETTQNGQIIINPGEQQIIALHAGATITAISEGAEVSPAADPAAAAAEANAQATEALGATGEAGSTEQPPAAEGSATDAPTEASASEGEASAPETEQAAGEQTSAQDGAGAGDNAGKAE